MATFSVKTKRFWLVAGGVAAVALGGCNPAPQGNTAAVPTVTPSSTGPAPSPSPVAVGPTIYVPGADGKVEPVRVLASFTQDKGPLLMANAAITRASAYFPPGTAVLGVRLKGKVVWADLTQNFGDQKFWTTKGEDTTLLAVTSLVNTLSANPPQGAVFHPLVQLTVAGKPVTTLGQFDASDPLPFDTGTASQP